MMQYNCSLNACFICFMLSDYSLNACSMLSECSWSELQTDYIMDSIILIIKLASTTFSDLEDPPQLCSVNSSWRLSRLINQWELPAQPADQWAQRRQISFWCSHGRAEQVTLSPLASLLLHFLPNIAREERGARIGGSKGGGGWLMITTLWGIRPLPSPAWLTGNIGRRENQVEQTLYLQFKLRRNIGWLHLLSMK